MKKSKIAAKVPLMFISLNRSRRVYKRLFGIASLLGGFIPNLENDLDKSDLELTSEEYMINCIINSFLIFIIFSGLLFFISYLVKDLSLGKSLITGLAISLAFSVFFYLILLRYPKILAKKKAENLEKNMIFALKDVLLQISSGISLYNALVNVSRADYGLISDEIEKSVKKINSGRSMVSVLEELAITSESEYLKKTIWQLVNTLRAGASLKGSLQTIIKSLEIEQKAKIRDYTKELNLWSLVYMLFAAAIPTIGLTMIVILSSFGGVGLSEGFVILFIVLSIVVQSILIGLIKTRRPVVNL